MSLPIDATNVPVICYRPPAKNIQVIRDVSVAREYLHSGLLVWRDGSPTNCIGPCWVPYGAYGIFIED